MKTIRISATEARNNFFNLLNQVMYEGTQVIIGKTGTDKEVVLMPKASEEKEWERRKKVLDETFGMLKDVPESHFFDDRFRGKRAKTYLERLRKGNV